MKKFFLTAAIIMISVSANAGETPYIETLTDPQMQAMINNFHHEMAECVGFYLLSSEAMRNKAEDEDNKDAADVSEQTLIIATDLYIRALIFHRKDVTEDRVEMAQQSMIETMGRNWNNYSLVLNEFAYACAEVVKNPEGRIAYWSNKAGIIN